MPEALALMNSVLGLSAGAGLSPRRARYFSLLRQRKVPKRKATPSLRPLRCAKGQTCGVSVAGCAAELTSRWRAPFRQLRRVSSRSMGASTPMPPRNRPAAGAATGGGQPRTAEQPHGSSLRSTQSAQREALAPVKRGRAKRWPVWMSVPHPLCMRRGAQRAGWRVCRRTHALRELTRCGCLSGAPQARSEFRSAPCPRAPQVAP